MNFSEVRSENQNVGLNVLTFSESTRGKVDEDYLGIVKAVANLTRMAAKRYFSEAIIPVKYYDDVKTDYQTYNAKVSKALFGYAIDQTYGLENFEKATQITQNQMMTSKEVERLALIEDKDLTDAYWEIYDFIDDYGDSKNGRVHIEEVQQLEKMLESLEEKCRKV